METSEPPGVRVKARVLPPLWRVMPRRPEDHWLRRPRLATPIRSALDRTNDARPRINDAKSVGPLGRLGTNRRKASMTVPATLTLRLIAARRRGAPDWTDR